MFRLKSTPVVVHLNAVLLAVAVALCTVSAPGRSFAQTPSVPNADRLTPSELEEILGPIALYPDPLLANVLAASVYSDEVATAAKFCASKPTNEQIQAQSWEDPVKAVAEFPEVIKMMGDFPDWTISLGQAYLTQAKEVMDTVQTLRTKAWDNGALRTSPQQNVVVEQKVIYIQPADPQIIYVPTYQPVVVYAPPKNDVVLAGVIGFGVGIAAGLIIANNIDCHWHGGCVGWGWGYHGHRHGGYWGGHNDVNIDRSININGDVNIGNRGDTNIKGGNQNTVIKGGDRTNIKGGDRNASKNRVGNEGNSWAPNKDKGLATNKPSEAGKIKKGGSDRMAVPDSGGRGGSNRPGSGGSTGGANPSQLPANRPGSGATGNAKPSQLPANRPGAASGGSSSGQPAGGGDRAGKASAKPTQTPAGGGQSGARPSQQSSGGGSRNQGSRASAAQPDQRPSAFDGGSGTRNESARGAASRNSSGSKPKSGKK